MPPERGWKPFHPSPCMFHATEPPSCSVQICGSNMQLRFEAGLVKHQPNASLRHSEPSDSRQAHMSQADRT